MRQRKAVEWTAIPLAAHWLLVGASAPNERLAVEQVMRFRIIVMRSC